MKIIKRLLLAVLAVVLFIGLYILWDNNRIVTVEETIYIENLPEAISGYKILQISDLHEKSFGSNQRRLVKKINNMEYDAVVFTGDMLDDEESTNYDPYYSLLDGMDNKEVALYVPGNTDPENTYLQPTYKADKHEFVEGMNARGVEHLESVYTVDAGGQNIHFVEFIISQQDASLKLEELESIEAERELTEDELYERDRYEELSTIDELQEGDVLISIYHYPLPDIRIDIHEENPHIYKRAYDLHIAGHYHGGQFRIPFYGALLVPEAYYDNYGLFPPQDRVKGFWEYKGLKQYVSAGLGSSDMIGFLSFRLFNPPEINVLTLRSEDERP